jgi:hypothetical protein
MRGWECFRFWVKLSVRFVFRDAGENGPVSHGATGEEMLTKTFLVLLSLKDVSYVEMVWVKRTELGTRKSENAKRSALCSE